MVKETISNSFTNYVKGKFLFCALGITIIVSLVTFGCMSLPMHEQKFANTTDPVTFTGATAAPSSPIRIEGYTPENGWQKITETVTGTNPYPQYDQQWYIWATTSQIEDFWYHEPASVGFTAKVRARAGGPTGIGLLPMKSDPPAGTCFRDNRTLGDFITNCIAQTDGGFAQLYTTDYRDFGKECVEQINLIRKQEQGSNYKPLARYKEGEAGADADAKCNYEDGTPQVPHPCPGPGWQNNCAAGDIEDILYDKFDGCLWWGLYEDEKHCYQKNPPSGPCETDGCYYDKACQCGHYLNMVICDEINKVACGLYEINPGYYKSVQNYVK